MKFILALVLIFSQITFAFDWDCSDPATDTGDKAAFQKFCALDAGKRQDVRDAYNLAQTMYVQGQYELCLEQISKIKENVAAYSNSAEIKGFCAKGLELERRTAENERREREAAESSIRRGPTSLGKIKMSN